MFTSENLLRVKKKLFKNPFYLKSHELAAWVVKLSIKKINLIEMEFLPSIFYHFSLLGFS